MMKIRVEIAEKPYRLTIPTEDESRVRRAALRIKEQIESLRKIHDATLVEYLAMAALRISIENEEGKERLESSPAALRLQALATQLDHWIESEENPKPTPEAATEKRKRAAKAK